MMGGSESVDFLAPSGSGENTLVTCENGDFAADLEVARAVPRAPAFPRRLDAPAEVETPGVTTIEALAELLGIDAAATSKAMPMTRRTAPSCSRSCAATTGSRARSCSPRSEADARPSTEDEIRAAFGADPGSLGPVGFDGEVVADEALREGQFVAGANRTGWHLRGVERGRDFEARFADIREPKEGDTLPRLRRRAPLRDRDRGRHIFKLGTRYSVPLDATFLDENGTEQPLVMGSYGIGPAGSSPPRWSRTTTSTASAGRPRSRRTTSTSSRCPGPRSRRGRREQLSAAGFDVLLDDRDLRAGEKFADADLIGLPLRVTMGKRTLEDGMVDVRERPSGDERRVNVSEIGKEG